jgi:hypothetical protein
MYKIRYQCNKSFSLIVYFNYCTSNYIHLNLSHKFEMPQSPGGGENKSRWRSLPQRGGASANSDSERRTYLMWLAAAGLWVYDSYGGDTLSCNGERSVGVEELDGQGRGDRRHELAAAG